MTSGRGIGLVFQRQGGGIARPALWVAGETGGFIHHWAIQRALCLFFHHTTPRGHWQTGCPHEIRCMKELEVQTVFQAVNAMLSKAKKTS
jgi:hypothetical protein